MKASELKKNNVQLLEKLSLAYRLLNSCEFCEHRCKVNRLQGEMGFCGATDQTYIYSEFVHYGIEIDLIPAYALFFSGCNMRCSYCSGQEGLSPIYGVPFEPKMVVNRINDAVNEGTKTVLLVGGEPALYPHTILELALYETSEIPFILDTNLYMTESLFAIFDSVIDIYLADFKFGNNHCAEQIAGVPRYYETITRNLLLANAHASVYIRHLLLPGHFDCCFRPIADWICKNLPEAKLHVMGSYEPAYLREKKSELNRKITTREITDAFDYAKNLNIHVVD